MSSESKSEFEYSEIVAGAEAAAYLDQLANGLRNGSLMLEGRGQSIILSPVQRVKLEIMADSASGSGELHFEISWKPSYLDTNDSLQILTGGQAGHAPGEAQSSQTES